MAVGAKMLLVGCGKMGGAMLTGWLERRIVEQVVVVEPAAASVAGFRDKPGVFLSKGIEGVAPHFQPDIVVFAVKPQSMDEVVPDYGRFVRPQTVFLSIAAGKPVGSFAAHLGSRAAIIRAMPNTPAAVGRGITVLFANRNVSPEQMALSQQLLEAVGEVAWIGDEALMDAVTAVSGSGPAYVFLLIEGLAAAGVKAGLSPDLAAKLARATVSGSGELARLSPEPADVLRRNVTSPGGTTAAALEVLMAPDGLQPLLDAAVEAATRRSRELAG
ncbi:pyrroline-5-carboxylate reductase [Constrictibacter sp. MBR-5]|jgi:pyrroline-5-carboxylate reductase|uniref:pyrroline-5-carboxylate reductase n=1 Tax=Constrictibacter sp. MBR-5 TaxID=3156467 RepID=UPI003395E9FE